jgi:hypothetical protein
VRVLKIVEVVIIATVVNVGAGAVIEVRVARVVVIEAGE